MPEYDTHDPRHRYGEIAKILARIEYITQLKNCNKEYVFNRQTAEAHIRKWYAGLSMCQAVTQRNRIQTAWTRYDYAVIKKAIIQEASQKPIEYENPEELV